MSIVAITLHAFKTHYELWVKEIGHCACSMAIPASMAIAKFLATSWCTIIFCIAPFVEKSNTRTSGPTIPFVAAKPFDTFVVQKTAASGQAIH